MVSSDEIRRKLEEKRRMKENPAVKEPVFESKKTDLEYVPGETLKHCTNCEVDYEDDTHFCPDCGSRLVEYEVKTEAVEQPPEDISAEPILESYTSKTHPRDITIVTSNYVPGYRAVKTLGFVYGLTVRSRGLGGQIGAGFRSVFGGEIKEYVHLMEKAREEALNRMLDHARELGANAIISARFDSDEISDIMQEILAYGTAVIIEKEEE